MFKRLFPVLVSTFLLASAAEAGPEFRVARGLLMLFDGGKTTPIRYNTQTDLNFVEGGSVRVFSTVTPQGTADVEVLARSKVDFYFVGADVSLAPSGSIRAAVENLQHPEIKVSWDGGTASASKVLQTPEELLSYFIVSQPPVFSKSPIGDEDLSKIFPSHSAVAAPAPPPETNDAVEVDFPGDSASSANPAQKGQAKPAISAAPTATAAPTPKAVVSPTPRSHPRRSKNESDKALLATLPQSTPGQPAALTTSPQPSPAPSPEPLLQNGPEIPTSSPTPTQNSLLTSGKSNPTRKAVAEASPAASPELIPDLPAMASESPTPLPAPSPAKPSVDANSSPSDHQAAQGTATGKKQPGDKPERGPDHILKSLVANTDPPATASPVKASKHKPAPRPVNKGRTAAPISAKGAEQFAKRQIEPLNLTASETPKAMPRMPALLETNPGPEFLPIIQPQGPNPKASVQIKGQRPEEQKKDKTAKTGTQTSECPDIVLGSQQVEVRRALPVEQDRDAPLEAEKPPDNVPGPVVLSRQATTEQPQPQSTPFVISSAIKKSPPPTKNR
jgi:hypothetical protein